MPDPREARPVTPDDLIERIKQRCGGTIVWHAMNADKTASCMWFTFEPQAEDWLRENADTAARGYHIVAQRESTEAELLANEAATVLASQSARIAALEAALRRVTELADTLARDVPVTRSCWRVIDAARATLAGET